MKPFAILAVTIGLISTTGTAARASEPNGQVQKELERVLAAYKGVGNFSVSSRESTPKRPNQFVLTATAHIGRDGRLALKEENNFPVLMRREPLDNVEEEITFMAFTIFMPTAPEWTTRYSLFNGKEVVESINGKPATRAYIDAKNDPMNAPRFFESSIGLNQLTYILTQQRFFETYDKIKNSPTTVKSLGGGRTQVGTELNLEGRTYIRLLTIGADGFLERYESFGKLNEPTPLPIRTCIFSRPRPLSQTPDPFNWANFAPPSKYRITPAAKSILGRAARLYGGLKRYSVTFKTQQDIFQDVAWDENFTRTFHWEREKHFALNNSFNNSRIVYSNGTLYSKYGRNIEEQPAMEGDEAPADSLLREAVSIGRNDSFIGQLLSGQMPVISDLDSYSALTTRAKANQRLGKINCDVVEIDATADGALSKYVFWFAHDNGRLLRLQSHGPDEGQNVVDDTRLEAQRFNPTFAPGTFQIPKK